MNINLISCPYCGGGCYQQDDTIYVCDGFAGDIDGLIANAKAQDVDDTLDKFISYDAKSQMAQNDRLLSTDFNLDTSEPKCHLVAIKGTKQQHGTYYFKLIQKLSDHRLEIGIEMVILKKNANSNDLDLVKEVGKLFKKTTLS